VQVIIFVDISLKPYYKRGLVKQCHNHVILVYRNTVEYV